MHDELSYDIVINASSKYIWLVGQGVKTPPSHGGIMGSIPVRATELSDDSGSFFTAVSTCVPKKSFGKGMNFSKKLAF